MEPPEVLARPRGGRPLVVDLGEERAGMVNPALRFVAGATAVVAILCIALGGCASPPVAIQPRPVSNQPETAATAATVPEYYAETTAALVPAHAPDNINVRDTDTGAIAATVKPPRPYQSFGYVFATGIPNTWVAGAQPWHPVKDDNRAQPVTLFDVTFNPATRRVETSKLPIPPIPGTELVTVALSPDGAMLAEVTLTLGPVVRSSTGSPNQTGVAVLRVYTMTGGTGKPRVSSRTLATSPNSGLLADYSLTWLGDGRRLTVGGAFGSVDSSLPATAILSVDTSVPGRLAAVTTVALKFPPPGKATFDGKTAVPTSCWGAPIATSDGDGVICGGLAATAINAAGFTNVGIWGFDARTGQLTATWDRHSICCAVSFTMFPQVLWVGPTDRAFVATGGSNEANQGADLYVQNQHGLHQVPWPGLLHYPKLGNIVEPTVAW
jgi:hypothetical protein